MSHPFGAIPPTLSSATVSSWICEPGAMVNVLAAGATLGEEEALFISRRVDTHMRAHFARVRKFIYVHDFSASSGYTSQARSILTNWGIERQREDCVDRVVVIPPRMNRLFMMGVSAAMLVLRTVGQHIELADDLATVVRGLRLRPIAGG